MWNFAGRTGEDRGSTGSLRRPRMLHPSRGLEIGIHAVDMRLLHPTGGLEIGIHAVDMR